MSVTSFVIICVVAIICFFVCVTFAASDGEIFDDAGEWLSLKKYLHLFEKVTDSYKKGNIIPLLKLVYRRMSIALYATDFYKMSEKQREQYSLFKYLLYSARYRNENRKDFSDSKRIQYVFTSMENGFCEYKVNMPDEFVKELKTLTTDEINELELSDKKNTYLKEQFARYKKKAGA